MSTQLRLMCVLAHPDDESMGLGFTLAKYASEGVKISVVCATRGERGWMGNPEDAPGLEVLGQVREEELMRAADTLGLDEVVLLGYMDGEVDRVNMLEAAEKVAAHIRRYRPQVVIVFDPWGNYGHPDHIATTQFAQAGLLLAANSSFIDPADQVPHQVSKLYYQGDTLDLVEAFKEQWGALNFEVDGVTRSHVGWPKWAMSARIDGTAYWDQTLKAIECHATQAGNFIDTLRKVAVKHGKTIMTEQHFYRVYSLVNGGRYPENDLFVGLR